MKFYNDFLRDNEIICLSLSLNEIKIEELGKATFENVCQALKNLKKDKEIRECLILQKCNCVELYAIGKKNLKEKLIGFWKNNSNGFNDDMIDRINLIKDERVFEHLFKTGCGLKSLLIGDTQVLGQVRMARKIALESDAIGPILNTLFSYVGKVDNRIRSETNFHRGYSSIERLVTKIIQDRFHKDIKISIVGTGDTGRLILKFLIELGFSDITISNRTFKSAQELQEKYNVKVERFDNYRNLLSRDIVIFATNSPNYLVNQEDVRSLKENVIIDVGNPPNVDPVIKNYTELINLDSIKKRAELVLENRIKEMPKVEKIIVEELERLKNKIGLSLMDRSIAQNIKTFNLDLKNENLKSIFIIRGHIFGYIRDFLRKRDFIEVQTPTILTIATEPVKKADEELFQVNWYGKRAFLRQSVQLHKQILVISGFNKIFEIGPFWRAEKRTTMQHLSEAWSLDVEMRDIKSYHQIMKLLEDLIYYIIHQLKIKDKNYLKTLDIKINSLVQPFLCITYYDALKLLNDNNVSISDGEEIGIVREYKLYEILKEKFQDKADIFFIKDFPNTIKKFYTKPLGSHLTKTFDLIFRGWKLASGAQRETDYKRLVEKIKTNGLNVNKYKFYLNIFKNKSVPSHGGFGMGLDRLVARILNLENVKQTVLFPRTERNFVP